MIVTTRAETDRQQLFCTLQVAHSATPCRVFRTLSPARLN